MHNMEQKGTTQDIQQNEEGEDKLSKSKQTTNPRRGRRRTVEEQTNKMKRGRRQTIKQAKNQHPLTIQSPNKDASPTTNYHQFST